MTAAARRVWDGYVDQMISLGILRPVDAFALRRLCEDVAMLQELQVGMRQEANERGKPERERRKKLREIAAELKTATEPERITKLREMEAELASQREAGSPLVALLMGHEGRRLSATINALAARIQRTEMQFGLTPVSSQRLNGDMPPMMPGAAMGPSDSIEAALC